MRVIIVGAGIAGLTLSALLKQRGIEALIVEKTREDAPEGYVLGIWPLGSRVLHGLNLFEPFVKACREFHTYRVCDGEAQEIRSYDLRELSRSLGYSGLLE